MAARFGKSELGQTGLAEWGGYIEEDFLRELRGKEGYKRYNEMRLNSAVAGGMLMAIELSIRKINWDFTSDIDNDPRIDFLNENIAGLSHSWNDHVSEALTMLPFGYSIFEIVYQRVNGRIHWRKFAVRGQDTVEKWMFDDNGGLKGFVQVASPGWNKIEIPIEKSVLYRTKVEKNNPEGRSIFRTGWINYYYQKNIMQIEGIGVERDLAGLPVVKMPNGATTGAGSTDEAKAREVVRNIRRDEQDGVVLPDGWELELLSTGGSRQFDTNEIIKRYESRILLSMLAQFLLLGQDRVGTQALSEDQTDFFTMAINSVADIIAETFLKFPVKRLLELNGFDSAGIDFQHTKAGDVNLMTLADFLQKVTPAGLITWMPEDEIWLRGIADLPDVELDAIIEEREKKEQEKQEFRNAMAQNQPDQEKGDNGDNYGLVTFAAGDAPDDDRRRKFEKRLEKLHNLFFADQQKRIEKEVKKSIK